MPNSDRISITALIVTLGIALLITVPWFVAQLLVWKAEGHDYMLVVSNIIVTLLLWAVLGYAIYRNLRDANRAKALSSEMVDLERQLTEGRRESEDLKGQIAALKAQ